MHAIWNLPKIEFSPLAELVETRPVLLVTSPPAWQAVKNLLNLPIAARLDVSEATTASWDSLYRTLTGEDPEVIVAVGGGLTADAAKYIASKLKLPLTCLPTALSVDAFFTWASGIRQDGCVVYIETHPPEKLIVDLAVIASAPPSIRAAGICDVLSIAAGCWDWKFAHQRHQNPPGMEFIPYVYDNAQSI